MSRHVLITGGAGFIGSNYAARLLGRGERVTVLDNLSRRGADKNLHWLKDTFGAESFSLSITDIRNESALEKVVADVDVVVHLAGQVAVTTSVNDPRTDFEINALGTFNVLEAVRKSGKKPPFIYASTNKVYGGMEDVVVVEKDTRYEYRDYPLGMSEERGLDFHSPYGCSKGCGDQYVRDYHRIYGLPTVVFRQSCIYGPRQFGIEDQGWIAWFIIAVLSGKPISIYGDGKQVRDVLFVEDLLDAYDSALNNIEQCAGEVFNVGGGANNAMSVWKEFQPRLEKLAEKNIPIKVGDWRPGDQKVYISDIRKAKAKLGWQPKIDVDTGIDRLYAWAKQNQNLFRQG